jgi:hypothetical protein
MSQTSFWQQVDARIKENQAIVPTGFSPKLAGPLSWVGLHFWMIGLPISFCIASYLWVIKYASIMRIVRIIIWR